MKRIVSVQLPRGGIAFAAPFHISMEGMEARVLCRDEKDYDAVVKIICVCARRANVLVVIYVVVSNHCHIAILAASKKDADRFAREIKRMAGMWFSKRYGDNGIMRGVDVKAILLSDNFHVRNALAYIPRNALDNGCPVADYEWSGFRAMFSQDDLSESRLLSSMKYRERRAVMHTDDDLSDVPWRIDADGRLIPSSFCARWYLEQAFENDPAFFLKTIGSQDSAQMHYILVEKPRSKMTDNDLLATVGEVSDRWYHQGVAGLPLEKKIRLLMYIRHTTKTSVPQLARVFGLKREMVATIISKPR
ncbi:MAG: hypothetical protein II720_00590 [Bacteroidales bacterium]|nr:hypothetical protein [Bacteroidales bacterium]